MAGEQIKGREEPCVLLMTFWSIVRAEIESRSLINFRKDLTVYANDAIKLEH